MSSCCWLNRNTPLSTSSTAITTATGPRIALMMCLSSRFMPNSTPYVSIPRTLHPARTNRYRHRECKHDRVDPPQPQESRRCFACNPHFPGGQELHVYEIDHHRIDHAGIPTLARS